MTFPDARTVGGVLHRWAAESPDHVFLVCDDQRLTYGQLLARSTELAKALIGAGATRGTHVGLVLPNNPDFAVAALAIMRIGAVAVPISTLSTGSELQTVISSSDTRILLAAQGVRSRRFDVDLAAALDLSDGPAILTAKAPSLRRIFFYPASPEPVADALAVGADPDWTYSALIAGSAGVSDEVLAATEAGVKPSQAVVIVHTSGSTSAPKGVVHAHGSLVDHLHVLNKLRNYQPDDVLFSNSPFFWVGGFAYTFLGTLLAGATVLCSEQSDTSKILDMVERERPTMCNGYAASATALANDPTFGSRDLSSMTRGNLYSIMPESARPADPALRTNMLGMTEGASVVLSGLDEEDQPESRRGSFGFPVPGLETRIVDKEAGRDCEVGEIGELWLRGPAMMLGYYGKERWEVFDADGWFHGGDLFHRDADGHHYFHGRGDDMIKTAGANVAPAEVQQAILKATGLDSIVLGIPDVDRGAIVGAVLLTGEGAPSVEELKGKLAPLLSAYKIPKRVLAMHETKVPLRAGGKVNLAELKQLFLADIES